MRTVKDILGSKTKPFNFVPPGTRVLDALNLMNSLNLSYLVVMDGENYQGVFCERDYSRNVILKNRHSDTTSVKEVMTTDLPVVDVDDSVETCMNLMNAHRTRYLLALDDQQFAGVVTIHDLLRQIISSREQVFDQNLAGKLIDNEESPRIY